MKKLLLASVLAIASFPGYADDVATWTTENGYDGVPTTKQECNVILDAEGDPDNIAYRSCVRRIPQTARVTVAPPYQGPPPIGWVYGPYTRCAAAVPVPPGCFMWAVNVPADGLNVRTVPNGPPVMALVNGTPIYPVRREGDWLLVAAGCDLTPTFAWSWTAGVPLNRCWVYF